MGSILASLRNHVGKGIERTNEGSPARRRLKEGCQLRRPETHNAAKRKYDRSAAVHIEAGPSKSPALICQHETCPGSTNNSPVRLRGKGVQRTNEVARTKIRRREPASRPAAKSRYWSGGDFRLSV